MFLAEAQRSRAEVYQELQKGQRFTTLIAMERKSSKHLFDTIDFLFSPQGGPIDDRISSIWDLVAVDRNSITYEDLSKLFKVSSGKCTSTSLQKPGMHSLHIQKKMLHSSIVIFKLLRIGHTVSIHLQQVPICKLQ